MSMEVPSSLARDISPPRPRKKRKPANPSIPGGELIEPPIIEPTLAAIEAGKVKICDHLTYFATNLAKASIQTPASIPRLSISQFSTIYQSNSHAHGHHFVVHQHNHPKAGVHYDLRLQFSESSSVSFAIPKGLPGNPNSRSIGRMAIETRVHNYWNHLIESASSKTGSLLVWDTGTYEVLPRKMSKRRDRGRASPQTTDGGDTASDGENEIEHLEPKVKQEYENDKLIAAFQTRYIRLRLHGTKLPKNYTITLRLPTNEIITRPTARRKKRQKTSNTAQHTNDRPDTSDSDTPAEPPPPNAQAEQNLDTDSEEDAETRVHNAYPGSTNTIGSIHQRHWFLALDRQNSGFVLDSSGAEKGKWVRGEDGGGFEPFFVRGREVERSVVTGRLAREVEMDEGVEGYVGRGGWVGIEA